MERVGLKDVKKGRGGVSKTWEQCVNRMTKQMNLKRKDTLDREEWKKKIVDRKKVQPVLMQTNTSCGTVDDGEILVQ